jgi:hypothetical protein
MIGLFSVEKATTDLEKALHCRLKEGPELGSLEVYTIEIFKLDDILEEHTHKRKTKVEK